MSEAAGRDVGTTAAARDYFEQVLPAAPEPMQPADALAASQPLAPADLLAPADPLEVGESPAG
jgi:hypothetical protein